MCSARRSPDKQEGEQGEQGTVAPSALPPRVRARLAALGLALFANAYAMSNPFPYAPFMVMSFGLTDDREQVGYYAGYILSAFMLGRMVSSYPLGKLSDTLGRRPVIQLGLWSCVVFQLGFGLAPNFGVALLMRFLMGVCNGIIGVSKVRTAPRAACRVPLRTAH